MPVLSLKFRLYTISFIPLILLTLSMAWLMNAKMTELSQMQINDVHKQMLAAKEETLKAYIEIIDSTLLSLKQQNASREKAIEQLSNISYGTSGYIFGYDTRGNRLFQGNTNIGIGKNFWNAKDSHDNLFIQDIINKGRDGGGFSSYFFPKPGGTTPKEKMSYSLYEAQWDMVIGTGFYIDDIDKTIGLMQKSSDQKSHESFITIISLCAGISLIVGLFGYFIVRSILSPLRQFDQSIAGFASGNADLTARMDTFSLPEFNILSTNFNQFVMNLQGIVKSVTQASQEISNETHSMTAQANQVDSIALKQKDETEQVATAMTEMTATANEISQNALNAAQSAQTANERAQDATQTVSSAVESVRHLAGQIDQANAIVSRLAGNVHNISSSLDVIQDIAEQTNLLALNAAIEAARAGEQGRGFAVVADEVRNLASRTQQSTKDITGVLEQLRSATDDAVSAMDQSKDQSEHTVTQANSAGQALQDIISAIGIIMDMNSLIATATEEQNQVGKDISERIVTISDQSHQSADLTNNTRTSSDRLSTQANQLKALIDQFVV